MHHDNLLWCVQRWADFLGELFPFLAVFFELFKRTTETGVPTFERQSVRRVAVLKFLQYLARFGAEHEVNEQRRRMGVWWLGSEDSWSRNWSAPAPWAPNWPVSRARPKPWRDCGRCETTRRSPPDAIESTRAALLTV